MALPDWVPDPTNHDTPPDNVPGGLAAREIRALKKRVTELTASMIADDSDIAAGTVKGALDELAQFVDAATGSINTLIDRLDELVASEVGNDSSVAGVTVKDALEGLAQATAGLKASDIANDSTVTGGTVKDALDALEALVPGGMKRLGTWTKSIYPGDPLIIPASPQSRILVVINGDGLPSSQPITELIRAVTFVDFSDLVYGSTSIGIANQPANTPVTIQQVNYTPTIVKVHALGLDTP